MKLDKSGALTYVISSYEAEDATTANNCDIRLGGLPNNTKFYCEVISFYLDTSSIETDTGVTANAFTNSYLTLVADNLISSGKMAKSKMLDIICSMNFADGSSTVGSQFTLDNFNGKTVNFQLVDPYGAQVHDDALNKGTETTTWILTLKLIPLVDN